MTELITEYFPKCLGKAALILEKAGRHFGYGKSEKGLCAGINSFVSRICWDGRKTRAIVGPEEY